MHILTTLKCVQSNPQHHKEATKEQEHLHSVPEFLFGKKRREDERKLKNNHVPEIFLERREEKREGNYAKFSLLIFFPNWDDLQIRGIL